LIRRFEKKKKEEEEEGERERERERGDEDEIGGRNKKDSLLDIFHHSALMAICRLSGSGPQV
jgi:hypothetical protein